MIELALFLGLVALLLFLFTGLALADNCDKAGFVFVMLGIIALGGCIYRAHQAGEEAGFEEMIVEHIGPAVESGNADKEFLDYAGFSIVNVEQGVGECKVHIRSNVNEVVVEFSVSKDFAGNYQQIMEAQVAEQQQVGAVVNSVSGKPLE